MKGTGAHPYGVFADLSRGRKLFLLFVSLFTDLFRGFESTTISYKEKDNEKTCNRRNPPL